MIFSPSPLITAETVDNIERYYEVYCVFYVCLK
jgi:hypothetical protein